MSSKTHIIFNFKLWMIMCNLVRKILTYAMFCGPSPTDPFVQKHEGKCSTPTNVSLRTIRMAEG